MTDSKMRTTLNVLLICTIINVSACSTTSYSEINSSPESIQEYIQPGDVVKVTTIDRRILQFEVEQINALSISGDNQHVLISEISTVEKKQNNRSSFYYIIKGLEAAASIPLRLAH